MQYIGETGRTLRDRVTDHASCIRLKKTNTSRPTIQYLAGHSLKNFTILAIEQFDDRQDAFRHMKESTWQHLLQTAHPLGINNLKPRFLA